MSEESATQPSPKTRQGDLIIPPTMVVAKSSSQEQRDGSGEPKRPDFWAYAFFIALTLISFAPILNSDLLWSEYDEVERTPFTSMESLSEVWNVNAIRLYDPITLSSYFLEAQLPELNVSIHRLINILLHLTAALLLLQVLLNLKLHGAYASALAFSIHPATVQTLFWPGYRNELVGLVFILASLYFGIRNHGARDLVLALVLTFISTLLHPTALALPLLMALAIFFQRSAFRLHHYNRVLPLACIAIFVGAWTQGGQFTKPDAEELNYLTKAGQNLNFYFQQGFFPFELKLFHQFSEEQTYNVGIANSLLSFLVFLPFYVLIAFNFRKRWARGLLFGITSFLLLLIYGINHTGRFIDGSLAKEDHALYVALPAVASLVFCGLAGLFKRKQTFGKILWRAFFGLFLLIQVALTASYTFAVSEPTRMWQTMAEQWKDSWLPKAALVDSARTTESKLLSKTEIINALEDILEGNPERHQERIDLARIYLQAGQNTNALREYRQILRNTKPGDEFLEEAANLMDKLGLSWEANNARERINKTELPLKSNQPPE